ncbi:unnamed protein product [Trichogramma brassicae]|uniref:Uncharacterized protein n=1 Tax=Trichogramma brassicae TaxID=86971 RepID=A0A6H5IV00_9HYME|nr:unnamed protein product [Trichogramma brassicae]
MIHTTRLVCLVYCDLPLRLSRVVVQDLRRAELAVADRRPRRDGRHTAARLALLCSYTIMAEVLLRRGAGPNVANEEGTTPLHIVCEKVGGVDFARSLFEICDQENLTLLIDARDKLDKNPLHLALKYWSFGKRELIELLLSRHADPNLANKEGCTPLHTIGHNCKLAKMLFKICDEYPQESPAGSGRRTPG